MTQIISDLDFEEYLKIDRISASNLMTISKDPALYYYDKLFERTETKSMNFGKKLHLAFLEEEKFNDLEISKSATTIKEGFIGSLEYDYICEIKKIILSDSFLKSIFKGSKNETTILWEYEDIKLKSRPDLIKFNKNYSIVVDIKTTCGNSENDILRSIEEYKYIIQAQTYIKAVKTAFSLSENIFFYFLFCTKKPPFNVFVYKIDALEDSEFKESIELYKSLPSLEDLQKTRIKYLGGTCEYCY